MQFALLVFFSFFVTIGCTGLAKTSKKQSNREVASGTKVSDYQPEQEVCGTLNRVRYENHRVERGIGRKPVVKLLIGSSNIKFNAETYAGYAPMLAAALGNKAITTCYEPRTSKAMGAYLDFYHE